MIKIKNSLGEYVEFAGVRKTLHKGYLHITTSDNKDINCSIDHTFVIPSRGEVAAHKLKVGDLISNTQTVCSSIYVEKDIELYDPVEVSGTYSYIHDADIVSHNCRFLGSSLTLVDPDALFALSSVEPIAVKRNGTLKIFKNAIEDHSYVMTVDVSKGRGQDYSTFTVFDTTTVPYEQVAVFRDNLISPLIFPDVIVKTAKEYNTAVVVIENNDAGVVVCNGVYYELEYENTFVESSVKAGGVGVTMSKLVKRVGCSNLKDIIEMCKLKIYDAETIAELSAFEAKENSFSSREGTHDDLVMNLVMFAWFVSTDGFGYTTFGNLKDILYAERLKELEDDIVPFGELGNNSPSDYINPDIAAAIAAKKNWNL